MSTEKESGAEAVKKAEIKVKAAEAKAETALKTAKKTVKNTVASKKKPAVKNPPYRSKCSLPESPLPRRICRSVQRSFTEARKALL